MALVLTKAQKVLKPLKIFMYGPSSSGKTLGSLYLAVGMVMEKRGCTEVEAYKHVVLIDSEFGRGSLYSSLGDYNYLQVEAPYTTEKLIELITELNTIPEIDVIIVDSMTHYWSKSGGILEQKMKRDALGGNSYTNWQEFTQVFNVLIDTILESPKMFIGTARAKSDTVLTANSDGKMAPKTYGLKPDMRDQIDFEFDITINVDKDSHSIVLEKYIPGLDSLYNIITPELGKTFFKIQTENAVAVSRDEETIRNSIRNLSKQFPNLIMFVQMQLSGRKLEDLNATELLELESKTMAEHHKSQASKHRK